MSLNTQSLQPLINFIYSVADQVLINTYEPSKYKDVILPMTVIRRLDAVLEPTKEKVLNTYEKYKDKLEDLSALLTNNKNGTGHAFYNTSSYTLKSLLDDPKNLKSNFENYLNGFSFNVQDIISKFKFRTEIETLADANKLFSVIEKFVSPKIDLRPQHLPPLAMGYVFEDLLRRFNEATNAEAGRHFTPREIIELMTHVLFLPIKEQIKKGTFLIYDPCAGSGAMLTESKKYITDEEGEIKSKATIHVYGQENTPTIYAISKSDMLLKNEDPDKIVYGSTLSQYGFPNELRFDFMLTNPPYGTSWADDKKALGVGDKGKVIDSRFQIKKNNIATPVTTRINDGQLMFVMHMLSKMKNTEQGSRIASIHNGSALFTGDAGQGESEIRRHIIENDLLEAIISLPNDIFYNTGIPTYIFIITNRKPKQRKGKIQLINANGKDFFGKMKKPLGSKRNELTEKNINDITRLYLEFKETEYSKIFDNNEFGYSKIIVHRPLRLNVQFTLKNLAPLRFVSNNSVLREELYKEFGDDVYDKKFTSKIEQWLLNYFIQDNEEEKQEESETEISISSLPKKKMKIANQLLDISSWHRDFNLLNQSKKLQGIFGDNIYKDFNLFSELFNKEIKRKNIKLAGKDVKDILNAVSWRDANAEAVIKKINKDGSIEYESDPELKDYENIPLNEDIQKFFEQEVLPFASDAWWNNSETKIGYEINFNKYFFKFIPQRSKEEIAADLLAIEHETENLLKEIVG
ncbi:MAG: SAM-dependent DNA methyltransferase [Bacteroidetes bacterium]|nr:SAM-dependent DNA methyltransferase [Bacteroidota bacterium]